MQASVGGCIVSKMKRFGAGFLALTLVLALLPMGNTAEARQVELYDPWGELPKPTGTEKALTKLGRGLSNVLLGWAEIPVTFDRGVQTGRSLGYLVGVAPVLGTGRAVMRTGTGVFEMTTFPFSDRDVNYEAVLEPEYIF